MLNLIVFVYVALQVKWKFYDDSSLFFKYDINGYMSSCTILKLTKA